MKYGIYSLERPVRFVESGHFIADRGWSHSNSTRKSDVEILVGISGIIPLKIDDSNYLLSPGKVLACFPGETILGAGPTTTSSEFFWFHFIPQANFFVENDIEINTLEHNKIGIPRFFSLKEKERILVLATELLDISHRSGHSTSANFSASLLTTEIANDYLSQHSVMTASESRISQIKEWIRMNMNRDLSVGDIAEEFNVSHNYMSRMFKKESGLTIKNYLNKLKLDNAKYLLLTTTDSIQEVADKSYFNDYKYFFRIFKKEIGMTPATYRNTFTKTFLNNKDIDPGYDVGKIVSILEKGINESDLF